MTLTFDSHLETNMAKLAICVKDYSDDMSTLVGCRKTDYHKEDPSICTLYSFGNPIGMSQLYQSYKARECAGISAAGCE